VLGLTFAATHVKLVAASKPVPVPPVPDKPTEIQPVSIVASEDFGANEFANSLAVYTVPAGKRLVIQYVSGEAGLPAGQAITRQIVGVSDPSQPLNDLSDVFLPTSSSVPCTGGCGGDQALVINQAVTLYAEAGQQINLSVARNGSTGTGFVLMDVIGYLVDQSK
jgi:hypothetical protein